MSNGSVPDGGIPPRDSEYLLEVLIRAGLILALVALCFVVFSPFLPIMLWAMTLAVSLYPLHQVLARKLGGRQGLAASLIVVLGVALIVVPMTMLMSSVGDSVHQLIQNVQNDTLAIPEPSARVQSWPFIGDKIYGMWAQAHSDLPALIRGLQPKIGEIAKYALGFVAGIGTGLLVFVASFIIAGIIMAYGEGARRSFLAICVRLAGPIKGEAVARLTAATIRTVAQGVIGVAVIQAIMVGMCLLIADVPWAGVLALLVLILAIAQIPVSIVTLPAMVYIWYGDYSTVQQIIYICLLLVAGLVDNVLKPLVLGRGVDAPMPIILLGALGGMASAGILGMFIGATLLALGYQLFMQWVAFRPVDNAKTAAPDIDA